MRKWIVIGVVVLLALAAGGGAAAWYYHSQTETKTVRGSSTQEFVPADAPGETSRPVDEVKATPWPMYGFDAARSHVGADFDHRPPYKRLWSVETHDYIEFPPAVADDRLFVANQKGDFYAIKAESGRVAWRKDFGSCIAAGPAVRGHIVVQSVMNKVPCARDHRESQRGFVVALDARTGKELWRTAMGVTESSPLIVGNLVYVGSWNHKVYALSLRTGGVQWSYDTGEEIDSSAAFGSGSVYIGGNGGHMFALNAWTGRLRWKASSFSRFGKREYFYATPSVAYGRVYAPNTDGTVYAFGEKTGDLLWAQKAGSYVYTAPAVWRSRVYVGTYDGRFRAFDAATGDPVWTWDAPGAIHGAPTIMAGLVYFATTSSGLATSKAQRKVKAGKRGIFALDALTGKLVWQQRGIGQYSPIVADSERVYMTGSTRVYGLLPENGS